MLLLPVIWKAVQLFLTKTFKHLTLNKLYFIEIVFSRAWNYFYKWQKSKYYAE
jgi:hypothetical protein